MFGIAQKDHCHSNTKSEKKYRIRNLLGTKRSSRKYFAAASKIFNCCKKKMKKSININFPPLIFGGKIACNGLKIKKSFAARKVRLFLFVLRVCFLRQGGEIRAGDFI